MDTLDTTTYYGFLIGKIAFLISLIVSNFDFSLHLNLFMNLVIQLCPISQMWSSSQDLDVDCYKGTLNVTCHVLIGCDTWLPLLLESLHSLLPLPLHTPPFPNVPSLNPLGGNHHHSRVGNIRALCVTVYLRWTAQGLKHPCRDPWAAGRDKCVNIPWRHDDGDPPGLHTPPTATNTKSNQHYM